MPAAEILMQLRHQLGQIRILRTRQTEQTHRIEPRRMIARLGDLHDPIHAAIPNGPSAETRLTNTGYSQGLSSWSYSGDKIVFIVAAIDDLGKYDIYSMNSDGTNNQDITPDYFPNVFLCHSAVFSNDDSILYFVGEWWEQ